jgi:hypothetical protein
MNVENKSGGWVVGKINRLHTTNVETGIGFAVVCIRERSTMQDGSVEIGCPKYRGGYRAR